MSKASLITTDVDFEAEGVQTGALRLPYSHDRSAYGVIPIPIWVARRGDGPTVLLTGGNHGDEYEGPIALMKLMRGLPLERLNGRLIVVPALNLPAYLAGARLSPIDRLNLNRIFPGDRDGSPTEMIAHYVESVLLPMADYAFDFHAGGSSLDYLPTLFAERPQSAEERATLERLIAGFAPQRVLYMDLLGEDRLIGAAARRKGAFFLTGEFGGGARVSREGLAALESGIAGLLDATGVLPRREPAPPPAPVRRLAVEGAKHFLFAPCGGVFEPYFALGDEVKAGAPAGAIYDPVRPWREPELVHWAGDGLVLCVRTYARVEPGDCLAHLAADVAE